MYFEYILFLTMVVASNGMLNTSLILSSGAQEGCTTNEFTCGNGECISKGYVCDLYDDCEDGSDENNCTNHVCGSDDFRCQSGQCIDNSDRCNGFNHCADGSDEKNCLECSKEDMWRHSVRNAFKCVSSDKCIVQSKLCDSIVDCPDGSDEDPVTCQNLQCPRDEEQCEAGNCFQMFWNCNIADPCGDSHKIEKPYLNCMKSRCVSPSFECDAGTKCVDNGNVCDGVPDCEDGSDEWESFCSVRKCGWGEFQCQSGQCVGIYKSRTVVCDGHYDCKDESDKSDEANCTTCAPEAFKCGSGECVHKSQLCNSKAECFDGSDENEINCPHGSTPPVLNTFWRLRLPDYRPNVTLQHLTEDLAVYFDSSVSPNVTWPFQPLSQAWKYAKKTFELETLLEPGSQFLYVVLGKLKEDEVMDLVFPKKHFSFRSRKSGYRNVVDPGMRERNGWVTQNSANFEKLVSGLGYIVEIAMEGVENNADKKRCDSTLRNIVFYDIYIHLKGQGSADVVGYKANQFNRTFGVGQYNCFRDWYLPVYEKYGGATVLNNFFHIFKTKWQKKKLGTYSELTIHGDAQLNVGEFVHFWSGAAGEDLRYLAKSAFHDWNGVFMTQFAKAQTDFPNITYPSKIISVNRRNNAHLNYMDKSSSYRLRS